MQAGDWSPAVSSCLARVPGFRDEFWRGEVSSGRAQLIVVRLGGVFAGALLYWIDGDPLTLNIGPGAAVVPGHDPWRRIVPVMEGLARDHGCARVRINAGRQGVERLALSHGYQPEGWFYKEIARGEEAQ